jgi:hypothetical protein
MPIGPSHRQRIDQAVATISRGLTDLTATLNDPALSQGHVDYIQVAMALRGLRAATASTQNALAFMHDGVRKLDQGLDAADQKDRADQTRGQHQNLTYGSGTTSPGITKIGGKGTGERHD